MKVKILTRNPRDYVRQSTNDITPIFRNYSEDAHPFQLQREYTRALNAVKLKRFFAKPFVACLDGHKDCISCLEKSPKHLSIVASTSYDGELRLWNLADRKKCRSSIVAHNGVVRGLTFMPNGRQILTVGDDKQIKRWRLNADIAELDELPLNAIASKHLMCGISHHRNEAKFVTCGDDCVLWEANRNEPLKVFHWTNDQFLNVSFNPSETNLFSSCSTNRSIILYDIRTSDPVRKIVMTHRTNKIAWNPMETFIFCCANEDYNLYSYDSRNLKEPLRVYMDHVSAVMDCDYSPTGKEIVSGSYDKTIRLFNADKGHSRDIYHTKRMQRLTCVRWLNDNKFILSASDEMNIRLWKANASEKLGPLTYAERRARNEADALIQKFSSHPQIKRIDRHRQVPRHIYNAQRENRTIKNKKKLKEANRRLHSKPGSVPIVPECQKHVISEEA